MNRRFAVMLRIADAAEYRPRLLPDGGIEAAEAHVIERVLGVEAQGDILALGDAENAAAAMR